MGMHEGERGHSPGVRGQGQSSDRNSDFVSPGVTYQLVM
jgi:hypothetical protein